MGENYPHVTAFGTSRQAYNIPETYPTYHQPVNAWAHHRYPAPSTVGTASSHYTNASLPSGTTYTNGGYYYSQPPAAVYTYASTGATGTPSYTYTTTTTSTQPPSYTSQPVYYVQPPPKKGFASFFKKPAPITSTWYAAPQQPKAQSNTVQKKKLFPFRFGRNYTEPLIVRR